MVRHDSNLVPTTSCLIDGSRNLSSPVKKARSRGNEVGMKVFYAKFTAGCHSKDNFYELVDHTQAYTIFFSTAWTFSLLKKCSVNIGKNFHLSVASEQRPLLLWKNFQYYQILLLITLLHQGFKENITIFQLFKKYVCQHFLNYFYDITSSPL